MWLCLDFPLLPLEALGPGTGGPRAVYEDCRGLRQILLANAKARAAGIRPGMPTTAALALEPGLALLAREPAREAKVLKALAAWAECFTSFVSLEPPALLLEIAGSLRLFGGPDALWRQVTGVLEQRGFSVSPAIAPTPLAALWLARSGRRVRIEDSKHLAGAVAALPLDCLAWPEEVLESLRGMGVTRIGDCLRLPRQGFVRRFGAALLLELDRALGRLPDPRPGHREPECFCREHELSGEIDDARLLLEACGQLLEELGRFLVRRQSAVREVRFTFFHLCGRATSLVLRRRETGGGLEPWRRLLALRFERLRLPAPAIAIRLEAGEGEPLRGTTASLPFHGRPGREGAAAAPVGELVELLSARMGEEAVHGIVLAAEHRPQRAWQAAPPAGGDGPLPVPPDDYRPHWLSPRRAGPPRAGEEARPGDRLLLERPLWMLPEPLPLPAGGEAPAGSLTLLSGPERIETGWWDGEDVARDYFVAVDPDGTRLWVYRDRSGGGWYLHGMFG